MPAILGKRIPAWQAALCLQEAGTSAIAQDRRGTFYALQTAPLTRDDDLLSRPHAVHQVVQQYDLLGARQAACRHRSRRLLQRDLLVVAIHRLLGIHLSMRGCDRHRMMRWASGIRGGWGETSVKQAAMPNQMAPPPNSAAAHREGTLGLA